MTCLSPALLRRILGALLLLGALLPAPASARIFFGIGLPLPLVVGPPAYYAPPPYYPPPPVYYAPPAPTYYAPPPYQPGPAYSTRCSAGAYTCPLLQPKEVGDVCHCPAGNNWTQGRVG